MKRHLLVTNDFPPKVGGIQVYLWELWRRLDPESFAVLTASSHPDAAHFDAEQAARGVRIERVPEATLFFPTPGAIEHIRQAAAAIDASLILLDPALPLGLAGPRLGLPYGVLLHGAEVAVPARFPGSRQALGHVLAHADLVIAAGGYPAAEARRAARGRLPPIVEIPPGVDTTRFAPPSADERSEARRSFGLATDGPVVVSVSRLVPRKGMDVLIDAVDRLTPSFPGLTLAIAGAGRDGGRLERLAADSGAAVHFLGRVSDDDLPRLLGAADVFVMACRNRWLGLEQEGFGIVFLEAAAAGVPQIAGDSGGAAEAVEHGVTGLVLEHPNDPTHLASALRRLLGDEPLRRAMGDAARRRAVASFDYARLAPRLADAIAHLGG